MENENAWAESAARGKKKKKEEAKEKDEKAENVGH